jgi:two-component system response regulator
MSEPEAVEILLVEDNPNDAELTQRALKKTNLDVRLAIARDGAEALEYLLSNRPKPKVIFLDLKLPKIDGIEVLRRVRADDRLRSVPVVVLTSSQEERDISQCYKLGVNS